MSLVLRISFILSLIIHLLFLSVNLVTELLPRSWTVDLKHRKIRVNAISPGLIETPLTAELSEQVKTNLVSTVPMGRMGRPDEIAKAVAFLRRFAAQYISSW
jgi:NAD(P)-dependent dehydrogenase (short-subunit alcohol dehydrogenase family)